MRTVAEDSADQRNFQGCAWATRALQKAAIEQVRDMLAALTLGRRINIKQCERPAPGIPYAPHHEWVVSVDEWFVTAETREDAECKMLGLILRDGIGWPLLRGCKPNPSVLLPPLGGGKEQRVVGRPSDLTKTKEIQ